MDGPEAARRTGLKQGLLLNDFEAQALSLPTIPEGWERRIGPLKFGPEGPQVILGPGTGLGVAALVEADGRFTPVSSEACHIDFGPVRPEEFEIWPHLERAHGRITSESVISGAGLARVHRARMMAKGAPDPHVDPPAVTTAAAADPKGEEATSLRLYWHIVARFAGDMAVTFVATGGVTLSGGVLPRVVDFLDEAAFRQAFEAKAPVDELAKRIPTRLVTREDAVLVGMAAIASTPDRYGDRLRLPRVGLGAISGAGLASSPRLLQPRFCLFFEVYAGELGAMHDSRFMRWQKNDLARGGRGFFNGRTGVAQPTPIAAPTCKSSPRTAIRNWKSSTISPSRFTASPWIRRRSAPNRQAWFAPRRR